MSDTSTNRDWSQVAVMDLRSGKYGRDNPVVGFIYQGSSPRKIVETHDGPHSTDLDVPWELSSHTNRSTDGET